MLRYPQWLLSRASATGIRWHRPFSTDVLADRQCLQPFSPRGILLLVIFCVKQCLFTPIKIWECTSK